MNNYQFFDNEEEEGKMNERDRPQNSDEEMLANANINGPPILEKQKSQYEQMRDEQERLV